MELDEALRIVRALADGVDPLTGKECSPDALVRNAEVVIALHRAVGAMAAQAERERLKKEQPGNAYRWWSKPEEAQVCEELRRGLDLKEIAKKHNRTVAAVVTRLIKLGKIAPQKKVAEPLFSDKAAS
ncbi:MAG TPA: hypothetical protein VF753_15015 [Terriglobales bacterium]